MLKMISCNDNVSKKQKTSFTAGETVFLKSAQRRIVRTQGNVIAKGNTVVTSVDADTVQFFDKSKAQTIKAKYVDMFDKTSARKIIAGISAAIYSVQNFSKIISGGNIEVSPNKNKKGFIGELKSENNIRIGQEANIGIAQAPQVEVTNKAKVFKIRSNMAIIKDNTSVDNLTVSNQLRLSENAKVGRVVMTGENSEVHMIDAPNFDSIIFKKGNGKVFLHSDLSGNYPQIDEKKIKGGKIEKIKDDLDKPGAIYFNINHFIEAWFKKHPKD